MVLQIVRIVIAAATALLGVLVIARPASLESFAGVIATGGRGRTEIRAGMGAFYLALGLAPIIFNSPEMYFLLGITYLTVAVVRLVGMIVDKSVETSNVGSLASDLVFGILLILPVG
jgi:hypothetical protein